MRRHTLFILSLFAAWCGATAQPAMQLAQQADEQYRQGNFDSAIVLYESILQSGTTSAELHYNLAGAYFRTNNIGHAILNYERALRLKPSMSDARDNLAIAESRTVDRIAQLPKLFVVRWAEWLCTAITPTTWSLITLVFFMLAAAAIVGFVRGRTTGQRKAGFATAIAAALLTAVAALALGGSIHRYNSHSYAIITEQAISVKSSPEQQSVDKLLLHEGTKVQVLEELSGWYKIRIADGTTGWCQTQTIERI